MSTYLQDTLLVQLDRARELYVRAATKSERKALQHAESMLSKCAGKRAAEQRWRSIVDARRRRLSQAVQDEAAVFEVSTKHG